MRMGDAMGLAKKNTYFLPHVEVFEDLRMKFSLKKAD